MGEGSVGEGLPVVIVVGLGPAGPGLLTAATTAAITAAGRDGTPCLLRTRRHPAASLLPGARSFDDLYDAADEFAQVYDGIVAEVIRTAEVSTTGAVLYAVPGSPGVAEHTVERLRAEAAAGRIDLTVHAALSFADLAWTRLGIDPLAEGARIVDGHRFAIDAAGERGPLLVAQCSSRAVLSDVKLAWDGPGRGPDVTVLQRLGLPDEVVVTVAWDDLDRSVEPDHLTSLWIPRLAAPIAAEVTILMELMRTLRTGCPWDREQTHATLARYCVEEAYELAEAIDALGPEHDEEPDAAALEAFIGELGDVLFQVVFHAALGEEAGRFTLADVARQVHDKLVMRHPHVFPRDDFDASSVETSADVLGNWETIKAAERAAAGSPTAKLAADVPGHLPSLLYAYEVVKRLQKAGSPVASLREFAPAVADADLGDLLLATVVSARMAGIDAETLLRQRAARAAAQG